MKFVHLVDLNDATLDLEQQAERIVSRNQINLGVFIEYGCPMSRQMIVEVVCSFDFNLCLINSHFFNGKCASRRCFTSTTHWVMLDRYVNSSVFTAMEDIDLYVDAEVKILGRQNETELILYDVYNNGLSLGGKVKVSFDREVHEDLNGKVVIGESALASKLKYQNREDLSDITFKIAMVSQSFPHTNGGFGHILEFFESYKQPEADVAARIGYMLLKAIQETLNFR